MIRKLKRKIAKIKNEIKKLDVYSPYPCYYEIVMTENEKKVFDNVVKNSKYYLEFGSGGSTIRVLKKYKAKVYSVESSLDWIESLKKYFIIRLNEKRRLQFFNIDIGETKDWGFPVGETSKHLFPNYSSSIYEKLDPRKLDVIFIDGRFRVACILSTIINTYVPGKNNNHIILIHDFWNREYYHHVLDYLEVIDRADTIGAFKLNKKIDLKKVKNDYENFKYDYK